MNSGRLKFVLDFISSLHWNTTSREEQSIGSTEISNADKEKVVLEELRRRYSFEESRRKSVESKTSIVIGINALLVSLLLILSFSLATTIVTVVLAIASVSAGGIVLKPRLYSTTGKNDVYDSLEYLSDLNDTPLIREITLEYMKSIRKNEEKNEIKYECYRIMLTFTFTLIMVISIFVLRRAACSISVPRLPDWLLYILGGVCGYQGVVAVAIITAFFIRSSIRQFGIHIRSEMPDLSWAEW